MTRERREGRGSCYSLGTEFQLCGTKSSKCRWWHVMAVMATQRGSTVAPLYAGGAFQDRQWVPETQHSTEHYVYDVLPIHEYHKA